MSPVSQKVWSDPYYFIAFGFGSGLLPKIPGTWGSLAGLFIYLAFAHFISVNQILFLLFIGIAFVAGIWVCEKVSRHMGVHDHGGIVWDEMTGIWLVMVAIPADWYWPIVGFVLFRILDIVKPWPISWLDSRVKGGFGIMLDDIVAAAVAWLIIQLAHGYLQNGNIPW